MKEQLLHGAAPKAVPQISSLKIKAAAKQNIIIESFG